MPDYLETVSTSTDDDVRPYAPMQTESGVRWSGRERLIESLRVPLEQVIRFGRALAIAEGILSPDWLVGVPSLILTLSFFLVCKTIDMCETFVWHLVYCLLRVCGQETAYGQRVSDHWYQTTDEFCKSLSVNDDPKSASDVANFTFKSTPKVQNKSTK